MYILMPSNYLDLHIVDYCQLSCKHCYLNKGNNLMPINIAKNICIDFLETKLPLPKSEIILSGGEPLLHPNFAEVCELIRKLNRNVRLSTNGILIPEYIHTFKKHDGVQVSIDGDEKTHDYIRGEGSYQKAVNALKLLDEYGINSGIGFTLNDLNSDCIDHIIDLCIETEVHTLNLNLFHPLSNNSIHPVTFKKWLEAREYAIKRTEKENVSIPTICIEKGCIAGISGLSVLPDGTYWDCTRTQRVIGRYPQKLNEVLICDNIKNGERRNPFDTCCKYMRW